MKTRTASARIIAIGVLLAAAACSSGGQEKTAGAGGGSTSTVDLGAATQSTVSPPTPGDPGVTVAGGTPGKPGATGGAGATATTAAPGSTAPCTKPVELGISYQSDLAAAQSAFGHPEAANESADPQHIPNQLKLVIDDVNKHGGFAGCQVKGVYFPFQSASQSWATQSQQECTTFTQDHHVAAAISMGVETHAALDCIAGHKVPVVWATQYFMELDDSDFSKYRGYVYQPWGISMSRMGSFIDTLAAGGYFDAGTKLGILIADDGTGRQQRLVDDVWKPRLAALHIPVVSTFTVAEPQDLGSSLGNTSAQQQSAVLRFKAAGIDHVLFTPSGGALNTFAPAAESQRYRPRYAITSNDTPAGVATLAPKAQLTNSVAVGWLPVGDTGSQAAIPKNAATDRCLAIYKGQNPGFNVMQYCDAMFFLAAAYQAGGQATAAALQAGAERLGRSYTSTNSFGPSVFGPKRYDGASQVRLATFDAAKGAYLYSGPLRPAP